MKSLRNILFVLIISSSSVSGQKTTQFFVDISSANQGQVFDDILKVLMTSGYFVESVDKDAGLIRCKETIDEKRVFSNKKGTILEYNLLLRPHEQGIRIHLQANQKIKELTGGMNNTGYYNNDHGVSQEQKHYDRLMDFLKKQLIKPLE